MGKYLKLFDTHTEYDAFKQTEDFIKPNVSHCITENHVHYNPFIPPYQGFCKLMLQDNTIVEIEGSGELTEAMITDYLSTCVSAEIGTLCTSIGMFAFRNCTSLTSVIISNSVTSIGGSAFYHCSGLTSVNIPNSVTTMAFGVFNGCSSLPSIEIPNTITTLNNYTFSNCTSLTSITIPNSVTSIAKRVFERCSNLTNITIGSGVTSIAQYCFEYCTGLENIISLATTAPTITPTTFQSTKTNGTLYVPSGSTGYNVWMNTNNSYLGYLGWTKVEQ